MPPRFLFFDLGNVLLNFDHRLAARQMAEVAGVTEEQVWRVVFDDGLQWRYEKGEITSRQFYEHFCRQLALQPDYQALLHAGSDIFEVNTCVVAIAAQLRGSFHRLGILSNTCPAHWEYCTSGRFTAVGELFELSVLSYQVGSLKPEAKIFHAASEAAGAAPEEIFFVDDRPENVAGARQVGFDAVRYTTPVTLNKELRRRGLKFNY